MKRYALISGLVLSALALTNCTTKEYDTPEEAVVKNGVPFEIIAVADDETRTTVNGNNTIWESTDKLNLFHAVAGGTEYTADGEFSISDTATGQFSGTVTGVTQGTAYDWYAMYPYDASLTQINAANGTNRYYTLGSAYNGHQTQASVGSPAHLANLPLYGVKKNVTYNGSTAPIIQMNQLASVAAVTITNKTSAAINISEISLEAPENIVGTYRFNILGENVVYTPSGTSYVSKTATLQVTDGTLAKDAVGIFYIAIKPFTAPSGDVIKLTVTTEAGDSQTKEFNLAKAYTFSAGKMKTVKMDFTKEHEDLSGTYYQITSVSDITADGHYMIVMPDVSITPNEYLILKAGEGKTGNVDFTSSGFSIDEDNLISYTNPNEKYIWGVQSISQDGGVNFRYTSGTTWYGISASSSDVITNGTNGYWVPTLLSSNCFQLTTSLSGGDRYLSRGTTDVAKAYLTNSSSKFDQIAENRARAQYACAWAILKLGAAPTSNPRIQDGVATDISPRGAAGNTITITTKNTTSAVNVTGFDGTVVTAATISDNTVTFTTSNNLGSTARVGTISLALADDPTVTGTITVNQLGSAFHLPSNETSAAKEVNAGANSTATITVTSDFDWTIDATSLVDATAAPASFTYTDTKTQTVTITATAANASANVKDLGSFQIVRTADNAKLTVTVTQKAAKLAAPTGLNVAWSNKANLLAGATWNAVTNASGYAYKVEYNDGTIFITETSASATSATFTIASGTLYKLYVKAVGDGTTWFDSDWSAAYSFNLSAETESDFTWDLTTNSYASATESLVTWSNAFASMTLAKNTSQTNANNYLGDNTNTHTRMYKDQILSITPASGITITKIEITCTGASYTDEIENNWSNATASVSGSVVTVIPTVGTNAVSVSPSAATRVTGVKVYYTGTPAGSQQLTMSTVSCSNSGQNENSLTFIWTAVANASGYMVSTDGGSTWGSTITALTYTWSGLSAGTQYTLYVKAIGNGTTYTDSAGVSASGTTKAGNQPITATLTLSSSKKFGTTSGSTLTDDRNNTWTCTGTSIQNTYSSDYAGQQFGTSKTNYSYSFTTTVSGKTIKSVSIKAAAGSTTPTYTIKVGGTTWKTGSLSKISTTYSATDSATGQVEIILNQNNGSKAVYLGEIAITYQ